MLLATVRKDLEDRAMPNQWGIVDLRDLQGGLLNWLPDSEWVTAICVDNDLGLYVLTVDEDRYFTCPSIDLEFKNIMETN